jgi:hypothetical protein
LGTGKQNKGKQLVERNEFVCLGRKWSNLHFFASGTRKQTPRRAQNFYVTWRWKKSSVEGWLTLLAGARAALLGSVLNRVGDGVEGLDERRGVLARAGVARAGCLNNRQLNVASSARAALLFLASSLLALELALGALAVGGLDALVVAFEFLANRRALGFGSSAGGVALSGSADSLALGAVFLLAIVLGATNRANRAFAVNGAFSAGGLFAAHLALGGAQTGWHTAGHWGSSHCQRHWGWH